MLLNAIAEVYVCINCKNKKNSIRQFDSSFGTSGINLFINCT